MFDSKYWSIISFKTKIFPQSLESERAIAFNALLLKIYRLLVLQDLPHTRSVLQRLRPMASVSEFRISLLEYLLTIFPSAEVRKTDSALGVGVSHLLCRSDIRSCSRPSGNRKGRFGSRPSACLISFHFRNIRLFLEHWGPKDLKLCPDLLNVSVFGFWRLYLNNVLDLSNSSSNSRVPTRLVTYSGILRHSLRPVLDYNEMWNKSRIFESISQYFLGFEDLVGTP